MAADLNEMTANVASRATIVAITTRSGVPGSRASQWRNAIGLLRRAATVSRVVGVDAAFGLGDGVVEELEAAPCLTGGWVVDEAEKNAGDDLQAEDDGGGAAEDVPPAGGAGGDLVDGGFDGRIVGCQKKPGVLPRALPRGQ